MQRHSARHYPEQLIGYNECKALGRRIAQFARGGGTTEVRFETCWEAHTRWARNQLVSAGDTLTTDVEVRRRIRGALGVVETNQLTDVALAAAVARAERLLELEPAQKDADLKVDYKGDGYNTPFRWSNLTYTLESQARAAVMRDMVAQAEAAGLLAAGGIIVSAHVRAVVADDGDGKVIYDPFTKARCTLTVRDPQATASGWAGMDHYDWFRVDTYHLVRCAVEKCLASRTPVAIEPGRYTTILEPQAVGDLLDDFFAPRGGPFDLEATEQSNGRLPFWKAPGQVRWGEPVMDARLTFFSEPPFYPRISLWPYEYYESSPARWIAEGRLQEMYWSSEYARTRALPLGDSGWSMGDGSYQMQVPPDAVQRLEELIATTPRGLLVTRFADVQVVDTRSWILTGTTRDGLWLIDGGKISKAVKNFRFTESLFTALNQVEQIGPLALTVRDRGWAECATLKVRDFTFASLADVV